MKPLLINADPGIDGGLYLDQLSRFLASPEVSEVFVVSYVAELDALRACGVLRRRRRTRILLRPPTGFSRRDAEELSQLRLRGLQVRQLRAGAETAVAHLKVILACSASWRRAIVGSSNLTNRGLGENIEVNVHIDPEMRGFSTLESTLERLWDDLSEPLDPAAFVTDLYEARASEPLHLLNFQRAKLAELRAYYESNRRRGGAILSLPTGTGKTIVAARFLLDGVLTRPDRRVLWIAPQLELLVQASSTVSEQRLFSRLPQLRIEPPDRLRSGPERRDLDNDYHVIFRSVRTAANCSKGHRFDVVVVDEAHWGASESRTLLPKLSKGLKGAFWLGLTATPFRRTAQDQRFLRQRFPRIIERPPNIEEETDAVGRRVRAKVYPEQASTGGFSIALDVATLTAFELDKSKLREFNDPQRNKAIARRWNRARYGQTLAFAIDTTHANALCSEFNRSHPRARVQVLHSGDVSGWRLRLPVPPASGRFGEEERRQVYQRFRRGEIDVLIGVNLYTTGVDFPSVQTLFMSRPTLSPVLYAQMLGRGRRGPAFGGTDTVTVVDFADQLETHEALRARLMTYELEQDFDAELQRRADAWGYVKDHLREEMPVREARHRSFAAGVYRVLTPGGRLRKGLRRVRDLSGALWRYSEGAPHRNGHSAEIFVSNDRYTLTEVEALVREFAPDSQFPK